MIDDPGELVDDAWYVTCNPDVREAGLDPRAHFRAHGLAEGRDPNAFFLSAWYLARHPDVTAAGLSAADHYLAHGAAELRPPHPRFDARFYATEHPEAAANPLLHYLQVGRARGWRIAPAPDFTDYLPAPQRLLFPPATVAVDVVIPVYRGFAATQRCLSAVLADYERPPGDVIVIEDASDESDLTNWLAALAAERRIRLHRNDSNQGFVRVANQGFELAGRRDVALLNNDTEVPRGWLKRLAAHAYLSSCCGSVSPFSNNASICSYPGSIGGRLPFGCTLAELDAACRTANNGRFSAVPTTVGCCMYLRRDCLDAVGPFDVVAFGRGYGEENDFCMRANRVGWEHRLACDTFIYHQGGVSFADNAPSRQGVLALLEARHPGYSAEISAHVERGAAAPFRFAATAALFRAKGGALLRIGHAGLRAQHRAVWMPEVLIEATPTGILLSIPAEPSHPRAVFSANDMHAVTA
jgi:GT2 family glycosyltransferase